MAKVIPLISCPSCQEELPAADLSQCPYCMRKLTKEKSPTFGFAAPDYLFFQQKEIIKNKPQRKRDGSHSASEAEQDFQVTVAKELHAWVRTATPEDRIAALFDALLVMQNILHCDATADQLRSIVPMAKSIGKLAENIENYFRSGGMSRDYREAGSIRPRPQDDSWGEKPTP